MARTRGKDKGGSPLVATGDQHQRLPVKKQRRARNPSTIVAAVADAVAAADAAAAVDQPGPTFQLQDLVDIVEGNGPTQRHLPTGPMTVPPPHQERARTRTTMSPRTSRTMAIRAMRLPRSTIMLRDALNLLSNIQKVIARPSAICQQDP